MSKGVLVAADTSVQRLVERAEPEFAALCDRVERHVFRREARERLRRYLKGLVAPLPRKNGWQLAEALGETTPDGVQRLLNAAHWDADAVRDDLRSYVVEHLGDEDGMLIIDETGFLKKGTKSAGVKRQYSGTAGRIENCQVGVFLVYATRKGRTFLDRELYLPKEWTEDEDRKKEARIPEDVGFATKPEMARKMLERALDAGVPCAFVTGDEVYGADRRLRLELEEREQPFVLAVTSNEALWYETEQGPAQVRVKAIVEGLTQEDWQRLSCGEGAKGPRLYDWAIRPLSRWPSPKWEHWLLVRKSIEHPEELAYYVVFAPKGTTLPTLVQVAGRRWAIEECFEAAKGLVGLDQYEVRKWPAWYRYITLSLLAHAFLTVVQAQAVQGGRWN
ncbi:MAG TPA: IS701 family transposase [Armatimonadota bacterium]|jgi:SRSO17 transposase